MELRLFYGLRSPYSRLGVHKIAQLTDIVTVRCFPFLGPAGGAQFFNPTDSAPKLAYIMEDAPRMTAREGLPFGFPNPMEVNFRSANRACLIAEAEGKGLAMVHALSEARWGHGANIADQAVLEQAAETAGLPASTVLNAKDPRLKDLTAEAKAQIDEDQAFGVPFAVLDTGTARHRFWGQDRFDLIADYL